MNSPLGINAVDYTWWQLAQRVGVINADEQGVGFGDLDISVYYIQPDQIQLDRPSLIVVPCGQAAWQTLLNRPSQSLDWLQIDEVLPPGVLYLPFNDPIPILFWGDGYENGSKPFAERTEDGNVVFYADIIATSFFMLSRWEETVVSIRDIHERFPAAASVAYKQGFLDRPIVDEYALILREWLRLLKPRWEPKQSSFHIKLSHDIDRIQPYNDIRHFTYTLGGDIFKRRNLSKGWVTLSELAKQTVIPEQTIPYLNICHLAELSKQYSLDSAFYFKASTKSPFDSGYDPLSSLAQKCIADLRQQDVELGFHPGYDTFNNPETLAQEKSIMDKALNQIEYGGRQHYLRFKVPDTWQHWEKVGLIYDSTLGYADHEGFRCGTCHPFAPFDVIQDRIINLKEIPLVAMDGALTSYRQLSPQQTYQQIIKLASRCKNVEGVFTLLWHNTSFGKPWGDMYQAVLSQLKALQ